MKNVKGFHHAQTIRREPESMPILNTGSTAETPDPAMGVLQCPDRRWWIPVMIFHWKHLYIYAVDRHAISPKNRQIKCPPAECGITILKSRIDGIEKAVLTQAKFRKEFEMLQSIPGIGKILALTIMLEVGNLNRFSQVGNYSSCCRCVRSERLSNGKKQVPFDRGKLFRD